jgi:hypothetical protein
MKWSFPFVFQDFLNQEKNTVANNSVWRNGAKRAKTESSTSGPAITLIQLSYLAKLAPVTGTYKNNF